MAHLLSLRAALLVSASFAFASVGLGCSSHVEGGGGPDEGTGGDSTASSSSSSGGEGGSSACESYSGDGCAPGATRTCVVECDFGGGGDGTGSSSYDSTQTCDQIGSSCETYWDQTPCECNTPLVLSFDGAPVEFVADSEHGFDLNGARSQMTDWPTARTPWLALDRDGNGRIDDGAELFGSMTVLSSGHRATNGFEALRELDADGDGRITPADPGFAQLAIWADRDGDRVSASSELRSAREILSIDLGYTSEPRCDARGNCEVERASFTWRDESGAVRTGAIIDVHLRAQR